MNLILIGLAVVAFLGLLAGMAAQNYSPPVVSTTTLSEEIAKTLEKP